MQEVGWALSHFPLNGAVERQEFLPGRPDYKLILAIKKLTNDLGLVIPKYLLQMSSTADTLFCWLSTVQKITI